MSHWYDSTPKKSRRKRDSNPGSSALEADALPLGQRGGKETCEYTALGIAGVRGNERAHGLASTANITSDLQLCRAEVLRGLRNFLDMDRSEHHSINRLKTRGVENSSDRCCTLRGRKKTVFNQTNISTVSRAKLVRRLRHRVERVWAFPCATTPS